MTYYTHIIGPAKEMLSHVVSYVPTVVITLGFLIIGYVVAKTISKLVHKLLKTIDFDKIIDAIGLSEILTTGGIKSKPSVMLSSLVYWVFMIITFIITIKYIGLTMATVLLSDLLGYIPKVISGVFILIIGMLFAKLMSGLVSVVAHNTGSPHPEVLGHLTKLAIVIHVTIVFLREIGYGALFTGTNATILFGGTVLALALAFGLGGKDTATKYLDVFKIK